MSADSHRVQKDQSENRKQELLVNMWLSSVVEAVRKIRLKT
jgi:hypothetical protein